jgi:acetyltransferase
MKSKKKAKAKQKEKIVAVKETKENKISRIFEPKTIALIGASRDISSVGYGILKNLVKGCVFESEFCRPFRGNVYPINPNAFEILGIRCYPSIKNIEGDIDLAVIAVPSKIVLDVSKECVEKKVKGVIIISAGFAETGEKGKELQEKIAELFKKAEIPLIGPNCLGVVRPAINLNASFAPTMPPAGNVAFISQSGALADSVIDWAVKNRYGFSALVSYGNKADIDIPDILEWLEKDESTKAIAIYLEGIDDGRRFMEIAKRVSLNKPIICLKAGRTEKGIKAVSSHTGSLAGSYQIYESAFRQSNVFVAETLEELFDTAKALANQPCCRRNAVAVVTNGGGCGVLCADYCDELGVNLVEIKENTLKILDKSGKMHPAYSRANPLDIVGDALPDRYLVAVNTLLAENYIEGMIVIQTMQTMTNPEEDARIIIDAKAKYPEKPIVCSFLGGDLSNRGIRLLESNNIPNYSDLKKSALAMKALIKRGEMLKE